MRELNMRVIVLCSRVIGTALDELRAEISIAYEARNLSSTQLLRTQVQLDDAARDTVGLKESAVPYERLDCAGTTRVHNRTRVSGMAEIVDCDLPLNPLSTLR